MLTRDEILKANDIKTEKVKVPEWGGEVFIRTMTGTERDAFEQGIVKGQRADLHNIRAKLCALAIADKDGKRLFTERDVTALGQKSAKALDRIFSKAQKLNGISPEDVEDMAKNSGTGLSEDSISD
jgi:hypothetical protein